MEGKNGYGKRELFSFCFRESCLYMVYLYDQQQTISVLEQQAGGNLTVTGCHIQCMYGLLPTNSQVS